MHSLEANQRLVPSTILLTAMVILVGCQAKHTEEGICTPLMPQSYFDALNYGLMPLSHPKPKDVIVVPDNSFEWGEIAADCIIMKARQFSDRRDTASDVATAVLEACRPMLDALNSRTRDETCSTKPISLDECIAEDEKQQSDETVEEAREHRAIIYEGADRVEKEFEAAEQRAAIRYIVEARSGNCTVSRMKAGVPLTGFPAITR